MMRILLILAVATFGLSRCSVYTYGGIVDNGHHPQDKKDETPQQEVDPKPSNLVGSVYEIFGKYTVILPSSFRAAKLEAAMDGDRETYTGENAYIAFSRRTLVEEPCKAQADRRTEHEVDVYICSDTVVQLVALDDNFVELRHSMSARDIAPVIDSFQPVDP